MQEATGCWMLFTPACKNSSKVLCVSVLHVCMFMSIIYVCLRVCARALVHLWLWRHSVWNHVHTLFFRHGDSFTIATRSRPLTLQSLETRPCSAVHSHTVVSSPNQAINTSQGFSPPPSALSTTREICFCHTSTNILFWDEFRHCRAVKKKKTCHICL